MLTSPESLKDEVSSLVSALKAELDDVRQIAQGGDLSPPPPDTQPAPPAEDGQEVTSPTDVTVAVEESGQREQVRRILIILLLGLRVILQDMRCKARLL